MQRKLILAILILAASGCAGEDTVDAEAFVDGERKLTDDGAFAVELWHENGAPTLGENDFLFRLEFPDPNDPGDGKGIPAARIAVDCWMPNADHSMPVNPMVIPGAAGDYQMSHIVFDEPGVWQLDFEIAVGKSVVDEVSYVFTVDE